MSIAARSSGGRCRTFGSNGVAALLSLRDLAADGCRRPLAKELAAMMRTEVIALAVEPADPRKGWTAPWRRWRPFSVCVLARFYRPTAADSD